MRSRLAARAATVYAGCIATVVLHVLWDTLLAPRPNTSVGENLRVLAVLLGTAVLSALVFVRLPPSVRAWLAFVVGVLLVVDAGLHAAHARADGLSGNDVTGLLAGAAGVALLVVAVVLVLRPKDRRLRWPRRAGAAVVTVLTIPFLIVPLVNTVRFLHKQPVAVADDDFGIAHEDVVLRTSDGIDLAAWWVPPRNERTILLVHGSGGSRAGGIKAAARMLARNGFGVLLYDARGSGSSGGRQENLGWTWPRDVAAALDFLDRERVGRVGAFGYSTGADTVLDAAAGDARIRAVVADGAQARALSELNLLPWGGMKAFLFPSFVPTLVTYRAISGVAQPRSLDDRVREIAPRPVLLISTGRAYEREMNRIYARGAGDHVEHWELPEAAHTAGLAKYPREYEERVVAFFERALGPR